MIVEVKNLLKRYKDVLAIDNISFTLDQGEILGLLGPNGAGKTSTVNVMIGLTPTEQGVVKIFGKNLKQYELEIKKEIGIVPQDIAIFEDLTAYENLCYFGKLYGLKGTLLKERVEEVLEFSGLLDKKKEYPKKFSNGMKRRLNIACALIHHPKLIIMDEPTVGIDPQSRNHILQGVRLLKERGSTIIYISHYMEEVEEICTRIMIMDHGRIIAQGTKEELKALVTNEEKVIIELAGPNYTILDNLKKLAGVKDAYVDGTLLMVHSEKSSRNLSKIIAVVNANSEIVSLNVTGPNLETVFLNLTGRTLRD